MMVPDDDETPPRSRLRRRLLAPFEPVRVRITLATTLAFGLAFAGASVALVHTVRNTLESRQHAEADSALHRLASQLEAGADPTSVKDGSGLVLFQIVATDGRRLGGSDDVGFPAAATSVGRWQGPNGTVFYLATRRSRCRRVKMSIASRRR